MSFATNVFALESLVLLGVAGVIAYEVFKPKTPPKPITVPIPGVSPAGTPQLTGLQTLLTPGLAQVGAIMNYQSGNAAGAVLVQPPEPTGPGVLGGLIPNAWPYHDPVTGRPIPIPVSFAGGAPIPGYPELPSGRSGGKPQQAVNGTITSGVSRAAYGGLIYPNFARE